MRLLPKVGRRKARPILGCGLVPLQGITYSCPMADPERASDQSPGLGAVFGHPTLGMRFDFATTLKGLKTPRTYCQRSRKKSGGLMQRSPAIHEGSGSKFDLSLTRMPAGAPFQVLPTQGLAKCAHPWLLDAGPPGLNLCIFFEYQKKPITAKTIRHWASRGQTTSIK